MVTLSSKVTHQGHLEKVLQTIFPAENIVTNLKTHSSSIRDPSTGSMLQLDSYIPTFSLAFEFQDSYHYVSTWYSQRPLDEIRRADFIKQEMLRKLDICLIHVPFWWDGVTLEELVSSIHFARPDLITTTTTTTNNNNPISLNPPVELLINNVVPQMGEVMLASLPDSPSVVYESIANGNNWWLGEKYDGVRCVWNSSVGILYNRRGGWFELNENIKRHLDSVPIDFDGEIWCGRGMYLEAQKTLSGIPIYWPFFRLVAFDIAFDYIEKYENRIKAALSSITSKHPFLIIASRVWCNRDIIAKSLKEIIGDRGEGVILQKHNSFYVHGRSLDLLKLKASSGDSEAMVVSVGTKSITLRLPSGVEFKTEPNIEIQPPPKIGEIVTFEHETFLRRDTPANPKLVRIRKDMTWQDLLRDYNQNVHVFSKRDNNNTLKKTAAKSNLRELLQNFIKNNKSLDPSEPSSFYNLSWTDLVSIEGIPEFVNQHNYVSVLLKIFPELSLDFSQFHKISHGFWGDVRNRKRFFEKFASSYGFNPRVAENWYPINFNQLCKLKGYKTVTSFYHGSFISALCHLYPDIGIEIQKFDASNWALPHNRKQYLQALITSPPLSLDPLLPSSWYQITNSFLKNQKGLRTVLSYHKGSFIKAVLSFYHKIGIESSKFCILPNGYWNNAQNRRHFFDQFASKMEFDPLHSDNWYSLSESIHSIQDLHSVLKFHQGSLGQALQDLYPNIGIDISKIGKSNTSLTLDEQKRIMSNYAKDSGFDPLQPENWYSCIPEELLVHEGVSKVLGDYHGNLTKALMNCFPYIGLVKHKFRNTGYSYWANADNRKRFFDLFAEKKGFSPLNPDSWYNISKEDLQKHKGFSFVVEYHNGSFKKALEELYPNIGLQISQFSMLPKGHWQHVQNRKSYFESFAKYNNFDPLIADNWYNVSKDQLSSQKGLSSILEYHKGSFVTALMELFPDIGLRKENFASHRGFWAEFNNRKKFFESFAIANNFDPLVANNWYQITKEMLLNHSTGLQAILVYHKGNIRTALIDLFPSVQFDSNKFYGFSGEFWADESNRRDFFVSFAENSGFDPNVASNWYHITHEEISSRKGFNQVVENYKGSFANALVVLFPDIGLDLSSFDAIPRGYWRDPVHRKKFFDEFAKLNRIDPLIPNQWYSVSSNKILHHKGAGSVLRYYNGSITQALMQIYPDIGLEQSKFYG